MPLSPAIQDYVDRNLLTLDEANNLTPCQRLALKSQPIQQFITNGQLTFERALTLTFHQRVSLVSASVRELITDNAITFEQALALTLDQCMSLSSPSVRELITDNTITIEQALALTVDQRAALIDDDTRQRLRNGELTIQNILDNQIRHGEQNIPIPVNINNSQSTHTASVHRTVSESATRLLQRFHEIRNPQELEEIIISLTKTVNALPYGNQKNEAAKRCIVRLAAPDYVYTDPASGVNTRELLALSWLAVNDNEVRAGSFDDVKNQFIEGLYEIQRGYNLSEAGVDLHGSDVFICSAGTFNKLLEKLTGVHPDVTIEFITPGLAALKLRIVVKEAVVSYLAARANPSTVIELTQFTQQIKQIEEEGVEVIWDAIQDKVAIPMFDEFGSLYTNEDDHRFTGLIDAGKYSELEELSSFQKQISESVGYRKYCSSVMKSSYSAFFQAHTNNTGDDLSDEDAKTAKI